MYYFLSISVELLLYITHLGVQCLQTKCRNHDPKPKLVHNQIMQALCLNLLQCSGVNETKQNKPRSFVKSFKTKVTVKLSFISHVLCVCHKLPVLPY